MQILNKAENAVQSYGVGVKYLWGSKMLGAYTEATPSEKFSSKIPIFRHIHFMHAMSFRAEFSSQ